jgi:hypothetical protein
MRLYLEYGSDFFFIAYMERCTWLKAKPVECAWVYSRALVMSGVSGMMAPAKPRVGSGDMVRRIIKETNAALSRISMSYQRVRASNMSCARFFASRLQVQQ